MELDSCHWTYSYLHSAGRLYLRHDGSTSMCIWVFCGYRLIAVPDFCEPTRRIDPRLSATRSTNSSDGASRCSACLVNPD